MVGADDCAVKYQVPANQTPIATGKNKLLGSAYSTPQIPNFERYFNQVTPENAGKWGSIEGTKGVYNFTEVDQARAFAKSHNFPFRFHVLVWGSQQPTWLKPLSDTEKIQKVKAWFQAVANHFDGSSDARAKLDYIEVANETLNDPPNNLGPNMNDAGSGDYVNALKSLNAELGTTPSEFDWVVNSFKLARQYFPCETKLVLNEYNAETVLTDRYVALINLLKADNLLDVVGLQTHAFSTRKYNANQSFADHTAYLKGQLDKIAATRLPIMITEFDIDGDVDNTYTVTTNVAVKQAFQKSEYERIFGLYWNHPSVIGITLWGYLTGHWRTAQEAFLVDACSGQEKPALRDYLNNTLNNTPTSIRASGNPPLGMSFLPKICGIPAAAQYACATDVPVSSTAAVTASAVNCPGTVNVTVMDMTMPATPTAGTSYTITRTWTVTDACNNVSTATQKITVLGTCTPVTTTCGSPTATLGQPLSLVAPTYNCATREFRFNTVGGDGSSITYASIGISVPTTNCAAMVDAGIAQDIREQKPSVEPFTLLATQNGVTVTYSWNALTACSSVTVTPPTGNLALIAPTYNCTTGAFTFNTQGGNGSAIEYTAIGITGWTTNPNQFVDSELRTASDAQPLTLKARQNGVEVTYIWNIRAQCPVGVVPGSLQLVAPTYNCQSGAFTFNTQGGNGSAIEYTAIGITGWTTNPNQFVDRELRTAADAQPLTLKARQNGVEVTYVWNIRAQCPVSTRVAALAATEPFATLRASVQPNPVADEFILSLDGVANQPVQLLMTDLVGQPFLNRTEQVLTNHHEVRLRLDNRPTGVYILTVVGSGRVQSLRLIKR